jgi:hypothetical protein
LFVALIDSNDLNLREVKETYAEILFFISSILGSFPIDAITVRDLQIAL